MRFVKVYPFTWRTTTADNRHVYLVKKFDGLVDYWKAWTTVVGPMDRVYGEGRTREQAVNDVLKNLTAGQVRQGCS